MAKRTACPSCGLNFIKGRYVWRILGDGPVRQRVCQSCAALAVPVLASDAPNRCQACGKNLARFCHGCVAKELEAVQGATVIQRLVERSKAKTKEAKARKKKTKASGR